jgi:hypothetical protein
LWLVFAWFQAEFSAEKENSNSVMLEDTKASRCGLNGLDAAVESCERSVGDRCGKPGQDAIKASLQHASDRPDQRKSAADSPRVTGVKEDSATDRCHVSKPGVSEKSNR